MKREWVTPLGGVVRPKPYLHGGVLLAFSTEGVIALCDVTSGKVIRRFVGEWRGIVWYAVPSEGQVVVLVPGRAPAQERVYWIDLDQCELKQGRLELDLEESWSCSIPEPMQDGWRGTVLWTSSKLDSHLNVLETRLCCNDASGRLLWKTTLPLPRTGAMISGDPAPITVWNSEGWLIRLERESGEILSVARLPQAREIRTVSAWGPYLYACAMGDGVYVFDREHLDVVNRLPDIGAAFIRRPSVYRDRLYLIRWGEVLCLSPDATRTLFASSFAVRDENNAVQCGPCFVGDRLYFGSNNRRLWCMDAMTGLILESVPFDEFVIECTSNEQRLYVGSTSGELVCFELSDG